MFDRLIPSNDPNAGPTAFELFLRPRGLAPGQAEQVVPAIQRYVGVAGTTTGGNASWISGGLVRVRYGVTPAAALDEATRRAVLLPFIANAAASLGPNVIFELVDGPSSFPWAWVIGGSAAAAVLGLVWFGSKARRVAPNRRRRLS